MEAVTNSFITSCFCFGVVGLLFGLLAWRAKEGSKLANQVAWLKGQGWRRGVVAGLGAFGLGWCACISLLLVPTNDDVRVTPVALVATAEMAQDVAEPTDVAPLATATDEPTSTAVPTDTPVPTNTAVPTNTPAPTDTPTPLPTDTPVPTSTPLPTNTAVPLPTAVPVPLARFSITAVNKEAEYVDIRNNTGEAIDLAGWVLVSELGPQRCSLGGVVGAGQTLRIWAMSADAGQGGFNCGFGTNIWNNGDRDPAVLLDPSGAEVARR